MKKLLMILIVGMFLISLTSAVELNPFATKKIVETSVQEDMSNFIKEDFNFKYGVIRLSKTFFWFETDKVVEYSLIENTEQCLIDCSAKGKATLYLDGRLFEDFNFYNVLGNQVGLKEFSVWIKTIENYEEEVPDKYKEVCEIVKADLVNGTKETTNCYDVVDTYKTEIKTREVWKEYNGDELPKGDYEWEIKGKKLPTQKVDWVSISNGKELNEWAWWDGNWAYKKELKIENIDAVTYYNYSIMMNITYNANMQSDFEDLRFLDSTDSTELGYWIDSKVDSNSAIVWVKIPTMTASTNTTIYMYYGNAGSSTTSSMKNAFIVGDDFESGSLDSNWKGVGCGSITQHNGYLNMTCGETHGAVYYDRNISEYANYQWRTRVRWQGGGVSPAIRGLSTFCGFYEIGMYPSGSTLRGWLWNSIGSGGCSGETQSAKGTSAYSSSANTWYNHTIQGNGTTISAYVNDLTTIRHSFTDSTYSGYGKVGWRDYDMKAQVDWAFVVPIIPLSPNYYFGTEETSEGVSVSLSNPENAFETNSQTIFFNATLSPIKSNLTNVTLKVNEFSYFQSLANIGEEINVSWTETFDDGEYSWNLTACYFDESLIHNCSSSVTRTFEIDSVAPILTLNYPTSLINYGVNNETLQLNFTATDTNLDSVWYNYNGTNITITGATSGVDILSNITLSTKKNVTIYANDSFYNLNTTTFSWDYKIFNIEESYNSNTTEGSMENFIFNGIMGDGYFISYVNLIYNNIAHSSTYSLTGNEIIIDKSISIPIISTPVSNEFYWNFVMSSGDVINTSIHTQDVNIISIDDCSSNTIQLYNFTLNDEETKNKLTNKTSMVVLVNLYDSSKTNLISSFNKSYNDTNPARVCIDNELYENVQYLADVIVRYTGNISTDSSSNEYAIEYYNELNTLISNATIPKNIDLYGLKKEDSTEFQLTFRDSSLTLASNVLVYVYRQYIEDNDYKVVEVPLTDTNGQTILHLVRNDVLYNFVFVDGSGNILASFNRVTAFCEDYTIGKCSIRLNAPSQSSALYNYEEDFGFSYTTPTYYPSTNLVSFSYQSNNLSTITVRSEVLRVNDFGNRSVCNATLTSAIGTLRCNASAVKDTDKFLIVNIYVDGVLKVTRMIDLDETSNGFGIMNGAFYSFLMILIIVLLLSEDKQILVVGLGVGWAIILGMNMLNGSILGVLGASGMWLFVSIAIFLWKLKKEDSLV